MLVKKIVKFVILRLQYWNKVQFPFSADVSFESTFEGISRIYKRLYRDYSQALDGGK